MELTPLAVEAQSLNHWTSSSKVPCIPISAMSSLSIHLLPVALVHLCNICAMPRAGLLIENKAENPVSEILLP